MKVMEPAQPASAYVMLAGAALIYGAIFSVNKLAATGGCRRSLIRSGSHSAPEWCSGWC